MSDLEHFDRFDHVSAPAPRAADVAPLPPRSTRGHAGAPARKAVPTTYITSTRGPRFVDRMPCPMCGHPVGIEYQGELRDGTKINELATHAPGKGNVRGTDPRCLGARMRVEFVGGNWRGVPA